MDGYYCMHRGWMDHDLFRDETYSKAQAWERIIAMCAFKDMKLKFRNGLHDLKRGQCVITLRVFAEKIGWTVAKLRRFLKKLIEHRMILTESGEDGTVITVLNYSRYQTPCMNEESGGNHCMDISDQKILPENGRHTPPAPCDTPEPKESSHVQADVTPAPTHTTATLKEENKLKEDDLDLDARAREVMKSSDLFLFFSGELGVVEPGASQAPILEWLEAGADPEKHIKPTATIWALRLGKRKVRSLNYFTKGIMQALKRPVPATEASQTESGGVRPMPEGGYTPTKPAVDWKNYKFDWSKVDPWMYNPDGSLTPAAQEALEEEQRQAALREAEEAQAA